MAPRCFGLIPAAGRSVRMGQPKLLLPLSGRLMIAEVLASWQRSRVERLAVVVRGDDAALQEAIRNVRGERPIEIVVPEIPPGDMKASVQAALRHLEARHRPTEADAFLVAPADMPRLAAAIIDRLIERHACQGGNCVLAPTVAGKQGHPVLFPWRCAGAVFSLQEHEGLKSIVERERAVLVACDDVARNGKVFGDVDTWADYEEARAAAGDWG